MRFLNAFKMATVLNVVFFDSANAAEKKENYFPNHSFNSVRMDLDYGDVKLNSSPDSNGSITYDDYPTCPVEIKMEADTLVIRSDKDF